MTEFTLDLAKQLVESEDQFPVDFDAAWLWLGYSRKDNGKANFLKCGFIEGIDYRVLKVQESASGGGLTHREDLYLSIDCLKQWGMMSGAERGKQIRLYFLECEKIAKQVTSTVSNEVLVIMQQMQQQLNTLAVDHQRMNQLQAEKEAYTEASEIHPGCADVLKEENETTYPEDLIVTVEQYLRLKKLDNTHYHTLRKKAAQYYRLGKKADPLKNNKNQNVYVGSDIIYLDEALTFILGLG